jgi:hypothetical protein
MGKHEVAAAPAEGVAEVDETKAPKKRMYELVGATTFVADYIAEPVHKGETVSSAALRKGGVEAMEALLRAKIFRILATVCLVCAALFVGSSPAVAQETGVNFQYQSKIGWGGSYLHTLPTVFAELDALFTSIGSATTLASNLAATTSGKGASLVGVYDVATYFSGTTVEAVLAELGLFAANMALTTNGNGASMVGVEDVGTYFTGTDVEAALQELGLFDSNLGLTTTGNGASMVGVFDTAGYFTGTDVEAVLAEIGLEMLSSMSVIATPSAGYFPLITALGGVENSVYRPNDFALAQDVINKFLSTGNTQDVINTALRGEAFPATPADGFRIFCTADGGTFVEGKIYEYDETDGWDNGTNLLSGEMVQTRNGNWVLGGAALTDSVMLTDLALAVDLNTRITETVDITSDTIPPDPGVEGYRVFMTSTDTTYDEGKVYTWDDTGNVWDAGVLLQDGQVLTAKGGTPDIVVGGTGPTDYEQLSKKVETPECIEITITNPDTSAASAANPDWVGATVYMLVPVSGCDTPIAGHSVAADGAVTVSLGAAATTACVAKVCSFM